MTLAPRVGDLPPDLWLAGGGDFELAPSGLLEDQAALSPSTVARVKVGGGPPVTVWRPPAYRSVRF